jgi:glycosyltransferase involved in cell wall biosynthesis
MAQYQETKLSIAIVILTYNSEMSLPSTLEAARKLSNCIFSVDSFSSDVTVDVLKRFGVKVFQRKIAKQILPVLTRTCSDWGHLTGWPLR